MNPDGPPLLLAIGRFDQNPRARAGAGSGIEDTDFIILEAYFLEGRIEFYQCRAERLVQRIHRTIAFGDRVFVDAVDLDFDAGLANRSRAVASHRDVVTFD